MNILIFVVTILMLLSILTYGRLETYRTSQGHEILFKHYMEENERGFTNVTAERKYETTVASKKGSQTQSSKVQATPRISLYLLVNPDERESHQGENAKLVAMLKKLIVNLYSEQPFYKEIEQKRPTFLNEILSHIETLVESLPKDKKIKKAADLANLDLGDEELNEVFYKMLKGAPMLDLNAVEEPESPTEVEPEDDKQSQDVATVEAQEYKSPKGYYSLLDYVTANKSFKVRIYLAPRDVLKVIYTDDSVVDEIIKMRQEIYRTIKGDKNADVKLAGDSFKLEFDRQRDPAFDESVLDYSVSKTNPKKYE